MAHSSLIHNRKFRQLCRELKGNDPLAYGLLGLLWDTVYATRQVVDGTLNGWTAEDVETAARWTGKPGKLVSLLVGCGFLDVTTEPVFEAPVGANVYSIHDYLDWIPAYVKQRIDRIQADDSAKAETVNSGDRTVPNGQQRSPGKGREGQGRQGKEKQKRAPPGGSAGFQRFWAAYPRKVGKKAAETAYAKAWQLVRARLAEGSGAEGGEAHGFLHGRAKAYSASPAGQAGKFTPHPATWLNQGRYDDDPAEWNRTDDDRPKHTRPQPKPGKYDGQ